MEIKPWGYYKILHTDTNCQTKFLSVNPESRLSYQSHEHRAEHWFIVSGNALVTVGENKFEKMCHSVYRLNILNKRVLKFYLIKSILNGKPH
jgi:hypothetical protein